jgi:hypothetical protein
MKKPNRWSREVEKEIHEYGGKYTIYSYRQKSLTGCADRVSFYGNIFGTAGCGAENLKEIFEDLDRLKIKREKKGDEYFINSQPVSEIMRYALTNTHFTGLV